MVWRRLVVPGETSIADLHHIIQIAVGWEDIHLHRFDVHAREYGISYAGGPDFADNPREVRLQGFAFRAGERFLYEYNFTDSWVHDIRVEKILPSRPNVACPTCIDGRRACPPEDCGGPWAYLEILHILKWHYDLETRAVRELVGAAFDPKTFSRRDVNSRLHTYWTSRDEHLRSHASQQHLD